VNLPSGYRYDGLPSLAVHSFSRIDVDTWLWRTLRLRHHRVSAGFAIYADHRRTPLRRPRPDSSLPLRGRILYFSESTSFLLLLHSFFGVPSSSSVRLALRLLCHCRSSCCGRFSLSAAQHRPAPEPVVFSFTARSSRFSSIPLTHSHTFQKNFNNRSSTCTRMRRAIKLGFEMSIGSAAGHVHGLARVQLAMARARSQLQHVQHVHVTSAAAAHAQKPARRLMVKSRSIALILQAQDHALEQR